MSSPSLDHYYRPPGHPFFIKPIARVLERLQCGEITLRYKQGNWHFRAKTPYGAPADLRMTKPLAALWRTLTRGDTGFAESFIYGEWDSEHLARLLELLAVNERALNRRYGETPWKDRLTHRFNGNSRRGSRRNIARHYDLGNNFYSLWLDVTMSYSAARFETPQDTLAQAQVNKYQELLNRLEASPGDRLLEIGCGWGGFAEVAAKRGFTLDGITLSKEQLNYARERVAKLGLSDAASFELRDYRQIDQQYDHVVSIEMFEAVGEDYWPGFFTALNRALRPGGRASMQVITIDEADFDSYRRNADFIQLYIFPGGMLSTVTRFHECAAQAGFHIVDTSLHAQDYADTLVHWAKAFHAAHDEIRALGFDKRFMRMWQYYLAYCEAGFRTEKVNLARFTLEKQTAVS